MSQNSQQQNPSMEEHPADQQQQENQQDQRQQVNQVADAEQQQHMEQEREEEENQDDGEQDENQDDEKQEEAQNQMQDQRQQEGDNNEQDEQCQNEEPQNEEQDEQGEEEGGEDGGEGEGQEGEGQEGCNDGNEKGEGQCEQEGQEEQQVQEKEDKKQIEEQQMGNQKERQQNQQQSNKMDEEKQVKEPQSQQKPHEKMDIEQNNNQASEQQQKVPQEKQTIEKPAANIVCQQNKMNEEKQKQADKSKINTKAKIEQYVSKLQAKTIKFQQTINQQKTHITKLEEHNKILTIKTKQLLENEQKLKQNMRESEIQLAKRQKELEISNKKVQKLNQQLSLYRQMGDIGNLQKMVTQLQTLVQNQKQQLILLQRQNQQIKRQSFEGSSQIDRKYLQRMQQLQCFKQNSMDRISFLQNQLKAKDQTCEQYSQDMASMDNKIKQQIQKISGLEEMITQQRYCSANLQASYEQKINKMQQQMLSGGERDTIEDIIKDKQILLREYSKMELQLSTLNEKYENLKGKLQQIQVQSKQKEKNKVSRKDYNEILKKFMNCKSCLQKSIRQNKELRARGINQQGQGMYLRTEGKAMDEEESQLHRYLQVFNGHVKTSIQYMKQSNLISENQIILSLKKQIKQLQRQLQLSTKKAQKMQNLSQMLEGELAYKNNLLHSLMESHKKVKSQYYALKEQSLNTHQQLSQNIFAKGSLVRLEESSAKLLIKNRKLTEQTQKWKQLYYGIKSKYEDMSGKIANAGSAMEQQSKLTQKQVQQIPQQIAQKQKIETLQNCTQTQQINTFYYRQLKQTLSLLKKFPDRTKSMSQELKKLCHEVIEVKKKYEETSQKYQKRFMDLKREQNQNIKWRSTAKQQITKQFQDIREIIDNDKLITILRKAKYLIEELEKGDEEEGEMEEEEKKQNEE